MKVEVLNDRGLAHKNRGEWAAAEACFRQALAAQPKFLPALGNLAVVLRLAGRPAEGLPLLEKLVALAPGMAAAHYSLGNLLQDLGRHGEAVDSYRRALALDPGAADSWVNLGNSQVALDQRAAALDSYRRAVTLAPARVEGWLGLAVTAGIEEQMVEGLAAAERGLALAPDHARLHFAMAQLLRDLALGERAIAHYRRAVALAPADLALRDALLLALTYADLDADAWFAEHRRYGELVETTPLLPAVEPATRRGRQRLRIGYVSGDFRAHSIAYFTWPVFKAHNRERFELTGYFTGRPADRETTLFAGVFDHWRDVSALDDDALAATIRADGIDLLVDLSSHTPHNRLAVFARKPAPVQLTWLGYAATTGLSRIDWRLSDAITDPPGQTEPYHSERLFRLEGCGYCFSPSPGCPEAGPLPARRNRRLTLGSFSSSAKLTPGTVALWSRVLAALPDAVLKLFIYGGDDPRVRAHVHQLFATHGIAAARVEPFGKRHFFDFMALHQEVDLALDPLSFSGVTTTMYTLWMGVPVLTLPGRLPASRACASLLGALGLEDFIAADADDYVAIARRVAADLDALAALRAGLRPRLEASPLLDHAAFTRRLEDAYEAMWRIYLGDGDGV